MIKIRPSLPKLHKTIPKQSANHPPNCQNIKPIAFNTRGYFDPNQPFDQQYFKVKQKVFQKYRNKDEQYVMVDIKSSNKSSFIQRGCLQPIKEINTNHEDKCYLQKATQVLLKNYLMRKGKKEHNDQQKYADPSNVVRQIVPLKHIVNCRTHSRQYSSRVSRNSQLKSQTDADK